MGNSPYLPFTGSGKWLDRPNADDGLTQSDKIERLQSYLRGYDKTLPSEILEVLAHCRNAAEVKFIYPIITTSGWRRVGARALANGRYVIYVQEILGNTSVDFLIHDTLRMQRVGIEIIGPTPHLPSKAQQERLRRDELRRHVDQLRLISQDAAKSAGQSYRVNLLKEQLTQLNQEGIPENRPQNLRFWHSDLAYDVSDLSLATRAELMKDWLSARSIHIPEVAFPALVRCDHAGEVLFASRLAGFPDAVWKSDSCIIGNIYLMKVHTRVADLPVSFGIKPVAAGATRSRSLIIIHPPFRPRNIAEEKKQDAMFRGLGYQVYREDAENAKQLGYKWHQFIAHDLTANHER